MNEAEWQTRKQRIDTRLGAAQPAWRIIRYRDGLDLSALNCHAVEELPTANGPADYGFFVNGVFLGILEAKKVTVGPQNVLEQAKRYATGAFQGPGNWNGHRVPFLFASNGEIIWFLDVRGDKPTSRRLSNFHTGPALDAIFAFNPRPSHDWLLDTPPDIITRLRDYQRRCIIATEQAVIGGRRDLLLAMATGTGKTFLTVAQIYRLLESKLVRRVIFLVDRKALDQMEDERAFEAADIERSITAPDSNRKIIQEVAEYAYEHEAVTGRFPKMLIFAVNDMPHTSHADQLVKTCRDVFNQGDDFVKKITGNPNVDRPLQRIREFRNRPNPKVVVTVDMLSTGVDIPALEFIVFLRPVKSRILWEQMLGRGTRLCPDINKSKFVVFDCFDGTLIQYFRNVSSFDIEPPRQTPLTLPEVIENIWQNVDRDYHVRILAKRLLRIDKDMNAEAFSICARNN